LLRTVLRIRITARSSMSMFTRYSRAEGRSQTSPLGFIFAWIFITNAALFPPVHLLVDPTRQRTTTSRRQPRKSCSNVHLFKCSRHSCRVISARLLPSCAAQAFIWRYSDSLNSVFSRHIFSCSACFIAAAASGLLRFRCLVCSAMYPSLNERQ
jgi:hypothetical protein